MCNRPASLRRDAGRFRFVLAVAWREGRTVVGCWLLVVVWGLLGCGEADPSAPTPASNDRSPGTPAALRDDNKEGLGSGSGSVGSGSGGWAGKPFSCWKRAKSLWMASRAAALRAAWAAISLAARAWAAARAAAAAASGVGISAMGAMGPRSSSRMSSSTRSSGLFALVSPEMGSAEMGSSGMDSLGLDSRPERRSWMEKELELESRAESRLSFWAELRLAVRAAGRGSRGRLRLAMKRPCRRRPERLWSSWSLAMRLRIWARANWTPARSSMAGSSKTAWAGWTPRWRGAGRRVVWW